MRIMIQLFLLLAIAAVGACSRQLTAKEADALIAQHPKAVGLSPIETEAISRTSDTELIARTRIVDQTLNLKFRRYDNGWRWEFAETKGGGWIAADEVLEQLKESVRAKRGAEWAKARSGKYRETVEALDVFSDNIPGNPDYMNVVHWAEMRQRLASVYRNQSILARIDSPAERARRIRVAGYLEDPAPKDAWGHELLLSFNSSQRSATFGSVGPDGQKGTPDDVICFAEGRPTVDMDRLIYQFTKTWIMPEGLSDLVADAIHDPEDRKITGTKVVQ